MPLVEVEPGISLFVEDLGSGPAVLLVPGFGMTTLAWDRSIRALTEAGHRVIAVDQRGHGRSDKPLDGYDIDRLADDLAAVLQALHVEDVAAVGWSFGGQVAFRLAATRPEIVSRLVLVGSNAVRASRSPDFPFGREPSDLVETMIAFEDSDRIGSRRATIRSGFGSEPSTAVLDWMTEQSLMLPSWSAIACYRTMFETDLTKDVDKIRAAVLQISGSSDPIHSVRGARWLNERLASSRLVELENCGHYPMIETPVEFDRALLAFLAGR